MVNVTSFIDIFFFVQWESKRRATPSRHMKDLLLYWIWNCSQLDDSWLFIWSLKANVKVISYFLRPMNTEIKVFFIVFSFSNYISSSQTDNIQSTHLSHQNIHSISPNVFKITICWKDNFGYCLNLFRGFAFNPNLALRLHLVRCLSSILFVKSIRVSINSTAKISRQKSSKFAEKHQLVPCFARWSDVWKGPRRHRDQQSLTRDRHLTFHLHHYYCPHCHVQVIQMQNKLKQQNRCLWGVNSRSISFSMACYATLTELPYDN